MTNIALLESQAVQAAKNQNWQAAVEHNQTILEQDPENIGALNRLGLSYAQLGETTKAKKAFNQVLEIDKTNQIAKKHLLKLKNHQTITISTGAFSEEFIEEPGKTRTVELHRLAGKDQLDKISIGQQCDLKPKNRFVSVEVAKKYVGSLPEDLSARLTKLMKTGNEYACFVQAVSPSSCSVFIKEIKRSADNEFINSFPVSKAQLTNDMFLADDAVALQMEAIPVEIVRTDDPEDSDMESFPTALPEEHDEAPVEEEPEND